MILSLKISFTRRYINAQCTSIVHNFGRKRNQKTKQQPKILISETSIIPFGQSNLQLLTERWKKTRARGRGKISKSSFEGREKERPREASSSTKLSAKWTFPGWQIQEDKDQGSRGDTSPATSQGTFSASLDVSTCAMPRIVSTKSARVNRLNMRIYHSLGRCSRDQFSLATSLLLQAAGSATLSLSIFP